MLKLMLRRIGFSVALIVVVPALTFILEALTPGNATDAILGMNATPAQRHSLEAQLGLNKPLWDQYTTWFWHFLHGNLGTSVFTGQSVTSDLNARLGVTLSLIIGATAVLAIVGIIAGVASARREGAAGRVVDVVSISGLAVPNFWLAVILVEVLAVKVRLLPATGYIGLSSPGQWARSLVLPVAALAFSGVTAVAKQTREQMKEVLDFNFVKSLRANGVPERSLVYRHALRNAAIPVVTVVGLLFVGALSASVVIENVFVLPGLGSAAVQATTAHDIPVIQGVSVYFTVIVIAANFLVDLAYGWLNPKVRTR